MVAGWGARVDARVAERFARATGWPVVADPLSQLRVGSQVVSTYEALLRVPGFERAYRPELVVRIGAPLTSKITNAWLDSIPTVLVDPDDGWLDPRHTAFERVRADAIPLLTALTARLSVDGSEAAAPTDPRWLTDWLDVEGRARGALDAVLDDDIACEGRIARDVAAAVPARGTLVVASSLPVRALEWCMAPRAELRVLANRGANGIDGFVSTVLGVAGAGADAGPVVGLCGDLCFLHDTNGLLGAGRGTPATFVVVDNDGGGIFSYLPQHELPEFEALFATPQSVDVVEVARAHGVTADRVGLSDLPKLVADGAESTRVLVVDVDPATARDQHGRLWTAVAAAVA